MKRCDAKTVVSISRYVCNSPVMPLVGGFPIDSPYTTSKLQYLHVLKIYSFDQIYIYIFTGVSFSVYKLTKINNKINRRKLLEENITNTEYLKL